MNESTVRTNTVNTSFKKFKGSGRNGADFEVYKIKSNIQLHMYRHLGGFTCSGAIGREKTYLYIPNITPDSLPLPVLGVRVRIMS